VLAELIVKDCTKSAPAAKSKPERLERHNLQDQIFVCEPLQNGGFFVILHPHRWYSPSLSTLKALGVKDVP